MAQTTPVETPTPVTRTSTPTPTQTATTTTPESTPTATPAVPSPAPTVVPTPFSSGVPCATDDPSTRRVERTERRGRDQDGEGNGDEFATGNGRNEVVVHNCTDSRLRVRASIQLNTIPGRVVAPLNLAYAEGSCMDCQTLAVALQVDLYSGERAREVRPENFAVAINTSCTHCVTVARAIQYVQPVEDPRDVAKDISDTVDALDDELRAIQSDPSVSLADAELRLNAVLERFIALGGTLGEQRDEHDD